MRRWSRGLAAILFALRLPASAHAGNQEPVGINLGASSFFDGFGPQEPGVTYLLYGQGSFARRINDEHGKALTAFNKPKINSYVLVNQFYFLLPVELFQGAARLACLRVQTAHAWRVPWQARRYG